MSGASVSVLDSSRIDRLLRSLVGVADVRLSLDAKGRLRTVTILRHGSMQEHQLVRNVLSGLKAGFGLRLESAQVFVVLDASQWQAAPSAQPAAAAAAAAVGEPNGARHNGGNGNGRGSGNGHAAANGNGQAVVNGNGRLHANGNGHGKGNGNGTGNGHGSVAVTVGPPPARFVSADTASPPLVGENASSSAEPRLEVVEVDRHGVALRCRVVIRVGERVYSAIAEVRDAPNAEAEIAARVTLDALRAGGLTTARLDGVAMTTIAETVYVVAGVRAAPGSAPRASAAPLDRTMAETAASAVLRAHGPIDVGFAAAGTF